MIIKCLLQQSIKVKLWLLSMNCANRLILVRWLCVIICYSASLFLLFTCDLQQNTAETLYLDRNGNETVMMPKSSN